MVGENLSEDEVCRVDPEKLHPLHREIDCRQVDRFSIRICGLVDQYVQANFRVERLFTG